MCKMKIFHRMNSDMALTIESDAVLAFPQHNFHETFSIVLVFGQFFGIMPIYGLSVKNGQKIEFKWISPRTIYAFYNAFGAFLMAVMCVARFAVDGLMLDKTAPLSFYTMNFLGGLQFIMIAKNWNCILKEFAFVDMSMRGYDSLISLKKKFMIMTTVIMLAAFTEHLLFIINSLVTSQNCATSDKEADEMYFVVAFPSVFTLIEYTPWKAAFVEITNILSTVTWNFTDLFIILLSCAIANRFAQISRKLENNKVVHEKFWREIREDYNKLAHLTQVVDKHVAPLVLISFINNIFFICVQLYNSLKIRVGIAETIYYFFSFGFLLGRTTAVILYGAWVYDQSRRPLRYLHSVTSEHFCAEISRLIQQINASPVGITGHRYFMITRTTLLKIASTIVTFELMFLQFGPLIRSRSNTTDIANSCNF